jgi:Flp pilus assembly pilin Flp
MRLVGWTRHDLLRVLGFPRRWLGEPARLETGQSTVEYALVGALVVIAAAGAMTVLGDQVGIVFGHIKDTLATAVH